MQERKTIGWIGVGLMGSRIVPRLLDAGYKVVVNDVMKDNCAGALELGATFADSPAAVTEQADYIFSMIPNSEILKIVALGEGGVATTIGQGQVYVDLSTVDPVTSGEVAQVIEEKGGKHIRVCVSGSVSHVDSGSLTILASGEREAYEEISPIFEVMGNKQYYLGQKEEARTMKIIVNMLLGTTIQAYAEALVLGQAAGIDFNEMLRVISDSSAANAMMKAKESNVAVRDFAPMFTGKNMAKDMSLAMDVANAHHLTLPLAGITRQMYGTMSTHGVEDLDYSGVLLVNEILNGIKN
ncbi:MAG: NAD(P)-dependent oxidoreductase [Anaerovoracaceae bacterium]|jgi:3-hydroxyisobutyrate dehydrogenase-like beta-hydroxyacid dehydrogenase